MSRKRSCIAEHKLLAELARQKRRRRGRVCEYANFNGVADLHIAKTTRIIPAIRENQTSARLYNAHRSCVPVY